MDKMMPVIEVDDVYRFYHTGEVETRALRGVSFKLNEGESVALQGPSGSGKSTLLACITGLDTPDGGSVSIMGTPISRKSESYRAAVRAKSMGVLLQSGNLFAHLSVEENIMLQMLLSGARIDRGRIDQLLTMVELEHRRMALPAHISGGEAARAAIAIALSVSPKILVADEPTGEVDERTEETLLQLFQRYVDAGGSVLVATHSLAVASFASRRIVLQDGRVFSDE